MVEVRVGDVMDKLQHHVSCKCADHIDHPAQAKPGIHVFPDKLYVVACVENPLRWRSRYVNYWDFQKQMEDGGAILYTVELATGSRHFEVTDKNNPHHIQVRTRDEMFRKENLQNIGAQRLPLGVRYVAFIDADVKFTRTDWAQETLHLLQHYDVIQMFTEFIDLGPHHQIVKTMPSFMWNYYHAEDEPCDGTGHSGDNKHGKKWAGAPGLAWAYRMPALDRLGKLLDRCILGGGDSHMAYGLMQQTELAKLHLEMKGATDAYKRYLAIWQANAARLKRNVGYMEGSVIHSWHGPKQKRGYSTRWKILEENKYDPYLDINETHHGVIQYTGNKPKLRDDVRKYLRSRDEDSVNL